MTLYCSDCPGELVWRAVAGRTFLYAPDVEVPVPDDLVVPTCAKCLKVHAVGGAESFLETALRPGYEAARRDRVNFAVMMLRATVPELQTYDIAALCGVTEGCLTKVLSGEKVATPMLIRLLEAYCLHPEEVNRHLDDTSLQELLTLRDRAADLELKLIRNTASEDERREYSQVTAQLPQDIGEEAARKYEALRRYSLRNADRAVDSALDSGDPDQYRAARTHQRELERPEVEAIVSRLSREDYPSSQTVTLCLDIVQEILGIWDPALQRMDQGQFEKNLRAELSKHQFELQSTRLARDEKGPLWVVCLRIPGGSLTTVHAAIPEIKSAFSLATAEDVARRIVQGVGRGV